MTGIEILSPLAGWAGPLDHLRVKDVRPAEGEIEGLRPRRVLVQQIAEVGRRSLCVGDRQEHDASDRR